MKLDIQPLKMEQIDGSETSAWKNQTPGIHPKDYSQYPKHSESLKSKICISLFCISFVPHKEQNVRTFLLLW
jgi:hypothetical protein